jgi:hypothetical protein
MNTFIDPNEYKKDAVQKGQRENDEYYDPDYFLHT